MQDFVKRCVSAPRRDARLVYRACRRCMQRPAEEQRQ